MDIAALLNIIMLITLRVNMSGDQFLGSVQLAVRMAYENRYPPGPVLDQIVLMESAHLIKLFESNREQLATLVMPECSVPGCNRCAWCRVKEWARERAGKAPPPAEPESGSGQKPN